MLGEALRARGSPQTATAAPPPPYGVALAPPTPPPTPPLGGRRPAGASGRFAAAANALRPQSAGGAFGGGAFGGGAFGGAADAAPGSASAPPPAVAAAASVVEGAQPAAQLRQFGAHVRQKTESRHEKRAANLQEGWLNALRQDILAGVEAALAQELELVRQDLADRLDLLSVSVQHVRQEAGDGTTALLRAARESQAELSAVQAQNWKSHEALAEIPRTCSPDFSPVLEALHAEVAALREANGEAQLAAGQAVTEALREVRGETKESREACLQAIEASRVDLTPVYNCVRENKTIVDHSPVVASIAKSHLALSQHVTSAVEQIPRVDLAPVAAALRESRPDLSPLLKAVYDCKTDFTPVYACIRESQPPIDYSPIFEALRATAEQFGQKAQALAERPVQTDLAPILAALREQKPTVDLRAVLAAVRETRAVDLRPVLDAVDTMKLSVDSMFEAVRASQESGHLARPPATPRAPASPTLGGRGRLPP